MTSNINELSQALDKINAGQYSTSNDGDCADLLEVAVLLHNSGLPVHPPEHILSATVQRACKGLAEHHKSRRNAWMYSGLLGAAAALLIFVGIHGFPSMQDITPIVMPAPQAAPVSSHAEAQPEGNTGSPTSGTKTSSPEPTATAPEPSPPSPVQPSSRLASIPQAPPAPPETREALPAPSRQSPAPAPTMKEALPQPFAGKALMPALIALRPPDRYPDSIIKDSSAGTLRQIFYSGTPHELIITQRLKTQADSGTAKRSGQHVLRETDNNSSKGHYNLNRVVVLLHGQEVTLEGQQTIQELTELAKTLVPEKM